MNWAKVKIILIILFVLINIMLVGVLYSISSGSDRFSQQSIDDIKSILSKNNIQVADSLVDSSAKTMEIPEASPITSFDSQFVKDLQKKCALNEKGDFITENTIISVYDDVVHFENTDTPQSAAATDAEQQSAAKDYFAKFGIITENEPKSITRSGDSILIKYVQRYNGYDIFGSSAEATVMGKTVVSANVVWYEISEENIQSAKTVSFAEVLLDFAADKTRGGKACSIKDISLGYTVETDGTGNVRNTQMIPAAQITTDIESTFFYDMRDPS